jgi:hypothetical protein
LKVEVDSQGNKRREGARRVAAEDPTGCMDA